MSHNQTDAFKESIENIGYLSSIPQLLGMVSLLIAAFIADHIRANKTLTITKVSEYVSEYGSYSV